MQLAGHERVHLTVEGYVARLDIIQDDVYGFSTFNYASVKCFAAVRIRCSGAACCSMWSGVCIYHINLLSYLRVERIGVIVWSALNGCALEYCQGSCMLLLSLGAAPPAAAAVIVIFPFMKGCT